MARGVLAVVRLAADGVGGCVSFGPGQVPADQVDCNEAILRSAREQMLLNLVRMRFFEMPEVLR